MARRARLTHERLHELLHYDPDSGEFRWRERASYVVNVGDVAGSVNKTSGYRLIHIDGRNYKAHQLAWFYVTGTWARPMIDHRDLDRSNNRLSNLRRATASMNAANRRRPRTNTSGFKGVHRRRTGGRWRAQIWKDGRAHYLGLFATAQAAHAAYAAAARRLFGEFARTE
ncbi:MAG TPA: HNH endonuclease [Xanthobacteraceae bacterium]|nr:HNH endonuclease [Xanthobacteraceae bacterium]